MDRIIRAINKSFSFRLFMIDGKDTVQKAKDLHGLSEAATISLGRLLLANLLLASELKNIDDRLTLQIRGDGPAGVMVVTGDGDGHTKGYISGANSEGIKKSDGNYDIGSFVGKNGELLIIRDYGMKEPYTAHSPLITGEISEDIAAYYYQTERIPTAIALDVLLDGNGDVEAAGGYFLQAMPGVNDDELIEIEKKLINMTDMSELLTKESLEEIINYEFKDFEMDILDTKEVSFKCDCSESKISSALEGLHEDELNAMIEEDGGAEIICNFCSTAYYFDKKDLKNISKKRFDKK